mgnify:CR=1 FL=1
MGTSVRLAIPMHRNITSTVDRSLCLSTPPSLDASPERGGYPTSGDDSKKPPAPNTCRPYSCAMLSGDDDSGGSGDDRPCSGRPSLGTPVSTSYGWTPAEPRRNVTPTLRSTTPDNGSQGDNGLDRTQDGNARMLGWHLADLRPDDSSDAVAQEQRLPTTAREVLLQRYGGRAWSRSSVEAPAECTSMVERGTWRLLQHGVISAATVDYDPRELTATTWGGWYLGVCRRPSREHTGGQLSPSRPGIWRVEPNGGPMGVTATYPLRLPTGAR